MLVLLNKKYLNGDTFERENIANIMHEIVSMLMSEENSVKNVKCLSTAKDEIFTDGFIETFFKVLVDGDSDTTSVGYSADILSDLLMCFNASNGCQNSSH